MSILEAVSPTARAVLKIGKVESGKAETYMNAEIEITRQAFWKLYFDKRHYLASKPRRFVEDLLHEAEELKHHEDYSVRAAAEINRAACMMILEEGKS